MILPNPLTFIKSMAFVLYAQIRNYAIFATGEEREARRDICLSCEHRVVDQCRVCTCFIAPKTALAMEQCPKKKWKRQWRRLP